MNQLNILLLGSGGRESALARKISESPRCAKLWIAPGNAGTGAYGTTVASLKPLDFDAIKAFVADNAIDMIVVGNEDPLVAGIYDYFENEPVLVVGPSRAAAALEGSKDFAKEFMARHAIPTAAYRTFSAETLREGQEFLSTLKAPYVLKADGLAAGKGVLIISDLKEAQDALAEMLGGQFGESSRKVVIEEFLSGIECSVFVLTDGNGGYRILPVAKDYKRIGEGDTGPNTGGMGAVSPVVFADREFMDKVEQRIILPTVNGLKQEGLTYRGFIFLGLINCDGEPKVIEYNVRMGDPETEVVMPRLASDLVDLLEGAARGDLGDIPAEHDPRPAATVIAVSGGYPGDYAKGYPIEFGADGDSIVFHAGTAFDADGRVVTAGGRVLAVTSFGDTLAQALEKSYATLKGIKFQDMNYRRDIGRDVLKLMGEI
ncbi:MAG: phosphoribosylamine--glycine ligase [Muribaculaceae bacterium]|nr:phosphoribosylamine--glycine ligase [Muribaculaceae bacterium]MCI9054737.1 phosphoribosylamine--glycine ligase [Muribaculaceae bacterium]